MSRVAARDSGKTMVDAAFGEVMVTCEKLWWLIKHGERWLRPESRAAGIMVRRTACTESDCLTRVARMLSYGRFRLDAYEPSCKSCPCMVMQMFYKKAWVEYHPLGVVRDSPVCPGAAAPSLASMHSLVPVALFACQKSSIGVGGSHRAVELPVPQRLQPAHRGAVRRQRHRHQGAPPYQGGHWM